MRTQFADSPDLQGWAEGLPEDLVAAVRHEAIGRGMRPEVLVKQWTVQAAQAALTSPHHPSTLNSNIRSSHAP